MKFGYARVSSKDQNLERQLEVLNGLGLKKIFQEKISGKDNNRPQLKLMLELIGEGDEVYVKSRFIPAGAGNSLNTYTCF